MTVEVQIVSDTRMLERCFAIRMEVFVVEQRVPQEDEVDELDTASSTIHVLATHNGNDVGTARLLFDGPGKVHIGRVAVRKSARRLGVGRVLMRELEKIALEKYADNDGVVSIELSAQEQAMPFYASLGYKPVTGDTYLDAGIVHQDMQLRVSGAEHRDRM